METPRRPLGAVERNTLLLSSGFGAWRYARLGVGGWGRGCGGIGRCQRRQVDDSRRTGGRHHGHHIGRWNDSGRQRGTQVRRGAPLSRRLSRSCWCPMCGRGGMFTGKHRHRARTLVRRRAVQADEGSGQRAQLKRNEEQGECDFHNGYIAPEPSAVQSCPETGPAWQRAVCYQRPSRSSISSRLFGQSSLRSRDIARSASSRPPV